MLDISPAPGLRISSRSISSDLDKRASHRTSDLLQRILPGMVARGHGIDALSLYLGLARTVLLDLVVELDLPTPHDRPLRKPGGRNPWTFADTTLFVLLWMAGWHVESLGERFGRSAGGARYKSRHLGLPRRDRKLVFRPACPGEDVPGGILQGFRPDPGQAGRSPVPQGSAVRTAQGQSDRADADAEEPVSWEQQYLATGGSFSPGTTSARSTPAPSAATVLPFPAFQPADLFGPTPAGTPPVRKPKRLETPWTLERDRELAQRVWARQHFRGIARDMGTSPSAVQSRRIRLGLPSFVKEKNLAFLRPDDLVDHFDPSVVAVHIAAADYVERRCTGYYKDGKDFWFWAPRKANHKSEEYERLEKKRRDRLTGLPRPARTRPSVPLPFVSDPWDTDPAGPAPHPSSLPVPFAPPSAMMRA